MLQSTSRVIPVVCLFVLLVPLRLPGQEPTADRSPQAAARVEPLPERDAIERLRANVYYLASDTLEGRGIATPGVELAARHIRAEFKRLGLKSGVADGSYFQPFQFGRHSQSDSERTRFVLKGPQGIVTAKLGMDFQPLKAGGSEAFEAPLVFAGYGITTDDGAYDDYQGLDVADQVVLLMRGSPFRQQPAYSVFSDQKVVRYNTLHAKVENALKHGAKAVLLVNAPVSSVESSKDELLNLDFLSGDRFLNGERTVDLPLAHISRKLADTLLSGGPLRDLRTAAAAIDQTGKPISQAVTGWTLQGVYVFTTPQIVYHNVIGVLEGQATTAQETIIIGAHYDHLGYGQFDSQAPEALRGRIHPGADDNASGIAALLELARRFAARPDAPRRRLVFIAFCAEESGRIGSQHYASQDPIFPIEMTQAMLNFDMVGRLRDQELGVAGNESAQEFNDLLAAAGDRSRLKLRLGGPEYPGDSDHASFAEIGVPILYLCTGSHEDRHRPTDTADKINFEGLAAVVDFSQDVLDRLSVAPRLKFVPPPAQGSLTDPK